MLLLTQVLTGIIINNSTPENKPNTLEILETTYMPDRELQLVILHLLISLITKGDVLPLEIKKDRPLEFSTLTNFNLIILLMVPQLLFHRPLLPPLPQPPYPR